MSAVLLFLMVMWPVLIVALQGWRRYARTLSNPLPFVDIITIALWVLVVADPAALAFLLGAST
jgi:hypothetical protein